MNSTRISPRIVNQSRLAEYLGKSKGWLSMHLGDLQAAGFPHRLPHVDGFDLRAVDAWLDKLSGRSLPKAVNDGGDIINEWETARGAFK